MGVREGALAGVGWVASMTPQFWFGKRVLITGHTGFKGTWLILWLRSMGAHVTGYALQPPTEPNLFTLTSAAEDIDHIVGDVRDGPFLEQVFKDSMPEIVFHLAAQPLVRTSYLLPAETYSTNVMGTVNVLEAVRKTSTVQATIVITSDKCYENRETIWPYRETDAMGGHDPYSSSKGCAELVTAAYGKSFFAPEMGRSSIASVRAGNVIGGGDWAKDRLMADLMRGLLTNENIVIRRPRAVRPWQHVLEPLSGYLTIAEHIWCEGPFAWGGWNFGPEPSDGNRTVDDLARKTCELWGRPEAMKIEEDPNAVHEAGLLALDSTKARVALNWRPRWNFDTSVERTVEWYLAYAKGGDMRSVSLSQLAAFQDDAVVAAKECG